jgi:hypothetical protein
MQQYKPKKRKSEFGSPSREIGSFIVVAAVALMIVTVALVKYGISIAAILKFFSL